MKTLMSARDRRALTFGMGTIAILFAIGKGVPRAFSWERDARSDANHRQGELDRATAEIARADIVLDSAKARGARIIGLAPALIDGDSPATASAALAGIISGAAARSNVKIGALQLHADTASRGTSCASEFGPTLRVTSRELQACSPFSRAGPRCSRCENCRSPNPRLWRLRIIWKPCASS